MFPSISIIIPIHNSQKTILKTIDSLLHQTYTGKIEIIIVGGINDPTWPVLHDLLRQGDIRGLTSEIRTFGRDSNYKRNQGLTAAQGEILALVDSDVIVPPHWIATGITTISQGWGCAAGPLKRAEDNFWSFYVDNVSFLNKTPRINRDKVITANNFGRPGYRTPRDSQRLYHA